MSATLITGARLVDPASGHDGSADIRIEDGRIAEIGDALPAGPEDEVVSARGRVVAPALVDLRAHCAEPGGSGAESLDTLMAAAGSSGIGTITLSPLSGTGISRPEHVEMVAARALTAPVRLAAAGLATSDGIEINEIGLMLRAGAGLVGDGGRPIADTRLIRRLLAYASGFDAWVSLSPEDPFLSAGTIAHESDMSVRMGLPVRPGVSERIGIERVAALAELTGALVLFDRVSTAEGLAAVAAARRRGLEIAASVPATHLMFNEVDMGGFDPRHRLDPPLRAESDREALIAAISEGLIEAVVSDHLALPSDAKANPFSDAAPGSASIEALLPALCTLYAEGRLSLLEALRPVTSGPADLLGVQQGRIAEGAPADLIVFDPQAPVIHGHDGAVSQAPSAFSGRRLHGRVLLTMVEGAIVHQAET
jgi:dihydroorotase